MEINWIYASDQMPPQWAGELDFELLLVFKDDPGVYPGHRDGNTVFVGDCHRPFDDLECWAMFPQRPKEPPKYYYLKKGEIVQDGDEVEMSAKYNDPAKWVKANQRSIGTPAPDPQFMAHRVYRRLVNAV